MGWNKGYEIFESTVIGAYDLGKLDKDLLAVLMSPYRNTDIDDGGRGNLESKDGKGIKQIVMETLGLEMPSKPSVAYDDDPEAWDNYYEELGAQMDAATAPFGW